MAKPRVVARRIPVASVIERRDLTSDLMILGLEPEAPFTFAPGQYCTIGVGGVERPYSIVSAPSEPFLELFIERVPGGALTPALWKIRPGDVVSLRPRAKGVFTLEPEAAHHLMIATVTGIAPFVSMVREFLRRQVVGVGAPRCGDEATAGRVEFQVSGAVPIADAARREPAPRFIIFHGASHRDELGYCEELTRVAAEHPRILSYVPTVSRPSEARNRDWRGATGRVHVVLDAYLSARALPPPTSSAAYACGHPGMIAHVSARLVPMGFRVKEERYWPASW